MALSNAQYDAIMRIYHERQLAARRAQEDRISEVEARFPRLSELSSEAADLSLKKARAKILGDSSADFDLDAAMQAIADERRAILAEGGYPEDYLEPQYSCPICSDTGYVDGQKCSCFKQAEIDYLYAGSHTGEALEEESFARFNASFYSEDIVDTNGVSSRQNALRAKETAEAFVRRFDSEFQNLCIYGETGVGKTFLSHCIAGELIKRGKHVVYLTAYELFELLAADAFARNREDGDSSEHIFDCDLLIIDDLGTELTNSFVSSQLFVCINERILKKKATILSTNLGPGEFAKTYSERTFSRIMSHYTLIRLFGKDIRILKQLEEY